MSKLRDFRKEFEEMKGPAPENFNELSKEQQKAVVQQRNQEYQEFIASKKREVNSQHEITYFDRLAVRVADIQNWRAKAIYAVNVITMTHGDTKKGTEMLVDLVQEVMYLYTIRSDTTREMWVYDNGVYIPNGETYLRQLLRLALMNAYKHSIVSQVIDKIVADTYIDGEDFFNREPKEVICVANGLLNIYTQEFREHTPHEFHFTKLPVEYDEAADCPAIKKFFRSIVKNPDEDVPLLQEILGWFLVKEYKPEKAIMLHGSGRNGKGKTLEIMQRFIGEGNYTSVSLQELDPSVNMWSLGNLHKKLANFGGDLSSNHFKDTSVFKRATGRDSLKAERKHRDPLEFRNYAKMVFAANELPKVYEDVDGFWERWIMIDYPYKFYKPQDYEKYKSDEFARLDNPNIVSEVLNDDELSGMLNWALEGLARLEGNRSFTNSKTQDELRIAWLRNADSFAAFCMDHLVEDWGSRVVTKTEMRRAYSVYCRRNKGASQNSDGQIKRTLQQQFGSDEVRKTLRLEADRPMCWAGVRFKHEREHPEQDFSWCALGFENVQGSCQRVKQFLAKQLDVVSVEDIEAALPGVAVDEALYLLGEAGEVIESRAGFWQVIQ